MRSVNSLIADRYDPNVPDLVYGAFDEGTDYRVLRPQGASSWLLTLTLEGRGVHRSRGAEAISAPGDLVLWEPRSPQEYATFGRRWRFLWVHFVPRPHWREWLERGPGEGAFRFQPVASLLPQFERDLEAIGELSRGGFLDRAEAQARLELLLIAYRRLRPAGATGDPRLDRAIAYGLERLRENPSVGDLALQAGLSPSRFGELFAARTGQSPRAFFEQERLLRARQMLAMTHLPVKAIAAELGYQSEFYFSNRFFRLTGVRPTVYRLRHEGSPARPNM